jgi:hypothetical protein
MLYVYAMAVSYLTDELIILLQTQAEVALAAADGDPNVAIEILMSQQVCVVIYLSMKTVDVLTRICSTN